MVYEGMGDNSKKLVDSAFGFPANSNFISIFKVCNLLILGLLTRPGPKVLPALERAHSDSVIGMEKSAKNHVINMSKRLWT